MRMTATYLPEDSKLRLYSTSGLDKELYNRVMGAGFRWASKQAPYVAPMCTASREDSLIELCGEIDDEDQSLMERAEERSERFEGYSHHRSEVRSPDRAAGRRYPSCTLPLLEAAALQSNFAE